MSYDFYGEHKMMRKSWPLDKAFGQMVIFLSKRWADGEIPDTPNEFQAFLYDRMLDTMLREVVPATLKEKHLAFFREFVRNPATAIFIDLMRGTESAFFLQWLQDAAQADAFAMEPAYGYGRDFMKHYRKIPEYDPAIAMMDDAGFFYTRWRDEAASQLMRETGPTGKILSIACGSMPELRYFDYPEEYLESQHIVCYDAAPINFAMFFEESGLPYTALHPYQMNLAEALAEEVRYAAQRRYDLIEIKGYLSYALPQLPTIIPSVVKLLQKPGAKFAFDLQIANWTLLRNNSLFVWASKSETKFELLKNRHQAKELIDGIVKDSGLPVDVDVKVPEYMRNNPPGVFVTLTKKAT